MVKVCLPGKRFKTLKEQVEFLESLLLKALPDESWEIHGDDDGFSDDEEAHAYHSPRK